MSRAASRVCLIAILTALFGVISQGAVFAVVSPAVPLGQIKDDLIVSSRVAVDGAGSLYIVDSRRQYVAKYDKYSSRVAVYDQVTPDGRGLAVSSDGQTLYVSANTQIEILDTQTGVLSYLGGPTFRFVRVADVGLDDSGYVYVADAGDFTVKVFAPNGLMVRRIGSKGDAPGQFQGINGMEVDAANGRIYVADSVYTNASAPEVLMFTLSGGFLGSVPGDTGFGTAKLSYFNGMVVQNTKTVGGTTTPLPLPRLYVFDGFRSYMYGYEVVGTTLASEYSYKVVGYNDGELSNPQDAVYDPVTGRLFVACNNGRVEIFGLDGAQSPLKLNVAPEVPIAVSPVGESVVASSMPLLRFQNAVDADVADVLTYDVEVYAATDLVNPVASLSGIDEGDILTEVSVSSSGLIENGRHAWRVRAYDGTDYSAWSALQYFWLDVVAEPPSAPEALEPLAVDTVLDGSGQLVWGAASDSDPQSVVTYELEIAADENFEDIHAVETLTAESATLSTLQDYSALVVGGGYFWRVTAVDDDGLRSDPSATGAFRYDTSVLYVKSPLSGTKIYLGGDQAYPGKFVGEAPVELRDFAVGTTTVTAERAGFEPFVAPVEVAVLGKAVVNVDLVAAVMPGDFKSRPVEVAGQKLSLTAGAAPVLVDLNGDGLLDLLVMDAAGEATRYLAGAQGYLAGESLSLGSPIAGAAPFVVDWNDDGQQDLLVGGIGSLSVYDAMSGEPVVLQDVTTLLAAESDLVPFVGHLNDDSAKDLLVGTASGQVYKLLNEGSDESPVFGVKEPLLKSPLKDAVAPLWIDWDADGQRELLLATQGGVYLCASDSDGYYAPVQMLTAGNLAGFKTGGKGKSAGASSSLALGENLRVAVADIDGKSGKDLVVGNAGGELLAVVSHGDQVAGAYHDALLEKVAEIESAGVDMTKVRSAIADGKSEQVVALVEGLLLDDTLAQEVIAQLNDLLQIL